MKMKIDGLSLENVNEENIRDSPTYDMLVLMIDETLTKEVDVRENNDISFSAKDDIWGMEYRARSGFPLASYQEKWEALRPLKKGATNGKTQFATMRFSDFVTLSTLQAEYRIKHLAFDYLNSCPGPDEAAKNHRIHSVCRQLLRIEPLSKRELEDLAGALRYRLKIIVDQATNYKDRLDISFADCR